METVGYAALQIIPTMRGTAGSIGSELTGSLGEAGRTAGKAAGAGIANGIAASKAAVEKAVGVLAAAQNKAADAADKVGVAEAKLATLRQKGVTDAGRLAAAEAAVAKAVRDSEAAANKASTSATALARAQEAASKATSNLGRDSSSAAGQVSNLASSTDGAESSLSRFSKLAVAGAGLAFLGSKVMDVGKSFLDIGETFANVNKNLQFTTGATGESLDGMMESVKNIGKASPKSLGEISEVLSKLSQRTGLTGTDLETLTKQVMKTNAVMGTDTDINGLTQAFAAFGVQGKDTSAAMDELFKASRATGVGVNELAAQAVKGAPQFQQFGLSIGESAALMGSLDKAGISSDVVLTGLNKAMVNFAKDGRAPKEALNETIGAIKDFTTAGNDAAALSMAAELFGTKGAGQFVNAVKSGAVTVDQLTAAVDSNQKGVLEAGGAIPTLSSAWAMFKNNVIIALEPVATRVFGIFIDGLTWFRTNGVVAIQTVVSAFSGLLGSGPLGGVVDFFLRARDAAVGLFNLFVGGDFTGALGAALNIEEDSPLVGQLFDIRDQAIATFNEVKGGITAFVNAFRDGGDDITSSGFAGFLEGLGVTARNLYDGWNTTIVPVLQTVGSVAMDVGSVVLPILWGAFTTGVGIAGEIASAIGSVVGWLNEHQVVAGVLAGVILVGLVPAFVAWSVQMAATGAVMLATAAISTISGAQTAAAWVMAQGAAVVSAATQVASAYKTVGGWILAGSTAVAQGAIAAGAWVLSSARTVGALALQGTAFVAQKALMIGGAVATGVATAAQWAFNVALSANPISLIIIAIAALVGGLIYFFTQTETGKKIVTAAWDAILQGWNFLYDKVSTGVRLLGDGFRYIGDKAGEAKDWVVGKFDDLVGFVTGLPGRIATAASGMWNGLQDSFKGVLNWIIEKWNNFRLTIGGGTILGKKLPSITLDTPDIPYFRDGGKLNGPGGPRSDSMLIRASTGEFINRASSVTPQTLPVLEAINNGWVPSADFLHGMLQGEFRSNGLGIQEDDPGVRASLGIRSLLVNGDFTGNLSSLGIEEDNPLVQGLLDARALAGFADGGMVTKEALRDFAQGVDGEPYVWGGVNWGDCSGAVSALANYATGRDPFGSRFATGNEGSELAARGFVEGKGTRGEDLLVAFKNGGPGGGHTAATLPTGENFEMGGAYGGGKFGGTVGGDDGQFTDFWHLPGTAFTGGNPPPEELPTGDTPAPATSSAPAITSSVPSSSSSTSSSSGAGESFSPGGGVDSSYQSGIDTSASVGSIAGDFVKANVDQAFSDLGIPTQAGGLLKGLLEGAKIVEEHIHYHVADMDEAMSKDRARRREDALAFQAAGRK